MNGKITVKFFDGSLERFCKKHIGEFDANRFEIVAMRIFAAQGFTVTIYAIDRENKSTRLPPHKQPTRKFKIENVNAADIPQIVESFNFTLAAENFDLNEIEVMNR
jgi:hypothetical protein